jgi:hypothetical protein
LSIALLVVARLARTSPKSESKKFRPHIFIPSCSTNKLQSEKRGGSVLDQFYALNPPVPSILPYDCWLLRYKQITSPISEGEKFRQLFHPPVSPLATTIRKAWRVGFRPV